MPIEKLALIYSYSTSSPKSSSSGHKQYEDERDYMVKDNVW